MSVTNKKIDLDLLEKGGWLKGGRENFLLDEQWKPTFVAGVPPDYFSETGQRWGNPIYNWQHMQETCFAFWLERLHYSSILYDIIRIGHFRAFDTYWKASCETAVDGEWASGRDSFRKKESPYELERDCTESGRQHRYSFLCHQRTS